MEPRFVNQQKPTLVQAIAWMTLASGIVNVLWGLGLSLTVLLGTIGFGIICMPLTILPTVLGVFEIIYAAKVLSNPPQPVQPSTTIAVLEIVTILAGNVFSMVVGILALVFYNDLVVKDYFARLNGMPTSVTPVVPVEPSPIPDPNPAPIPPEPMVSPMEEPPFPQTEETPDEPKRNQE
jgi:hypothetical protein